MHENHTFPKPETTPTADDSLLMRCVKSFGCKTVEEFGRQLGMTPAVARRELGPLVNASKSKSEPVDFSDVWLRVAALVDERIGLLLSVREELNRKLYDDRKRRVAERARWVR